MEKFQYLATLPAYQPSFLMVMFMFVVSMFGVVYVFAIGISQLFSKEQSFARFVLSIVVYAIYCGITFPEIVKYDRAKFVPYKHDVIVATLIEGSTYQSIHDGVYCGRYILTDGSGREYDPCLTANSYVKITRPEKQIVLYKIYGKYPRDIRWFFWSN